MDKVREQALKALYEININQAYSNLALKKVLSSKELDSRDKAFVTEIVYGTTTWRLTIDWIISQFSKVKLKKLSNWVLEILRMGTYQIMFLDKVPPSAACNTSVELAKKYAKQSTGFVNAILRNIVRNKDKISFEDINGADNLRRLSIKYSFPEYLIKDWIKDFGEGFTESLLSSLLERPDVFIRINTLKTSRDAIMQKLSNSDIKVHP
ncbi:MAG TPA: transcription antitermination factor NusB, partial [Thermoclostridium sp.]|nr:transcription antitermination factor NusB [Thermoclostridium sp.]